VAAALGLSPVSHHYGSEPLEAQPFVLLGTGISIGQERLVVGNWEVARFGFDMLVWYLVGPASADLEQVSELIVTDHSQMTPGGQIVDLTLFSRVEKDHLEVVGLGLTVS